MANNHFDLGSTAPADEDCVQVGTPRYGVLAEAQALRCIALIRAKLGTEPVNSYLSIHRNTHDFGTYLTVEYVFDDTVKSHQDYWRLLDRAAPRDWHDDHLTTRERTRLLQRVPDGNGPHQSIEQPELRICARCYWRGTGEPGEPCPKCEARQCTCDYCVARGHARKEQ